MSVTAVVFYLVLHYLAPLSVHVADERVLILVTVLVEDGEISPRRLMG